MRDGFIMITIGLGLIVGLIYALHAKTDHHVNEVKAACENSLTVSSPNAAGQFIESGDEGYLMSWLVGHKNDRRIVAIAGIGTGNYGRDDVFIIVSEPVKAEKP